MVNFIFILVTDSWPDTLAQGVVSKLLSLLCGQKSNSAVKVKGVQSVVEDWAGRQGRGASFDPCSVSLGKKFRSGDFKLPTTRDCDLVKNYEEVSNAGGP